jgi:hypothetical protein
MSQKMTVMRRDGPFRHRRATSLAIHRDLSDGSMTLPQKPQQQTNATGQQYRLQGFVLNVRFQALFPLLGGLATLVVRIGRVLPNLIVFFSGGILQLLGHIGRFVADTVGGVPDCF